MTVSNATADYHKTVLQPLANKFAQVLQRHGNAVNVRGAYTNQHTAAFMLDSLIADTDDLHRDLLAASGLPWLRIMPAVNQLPVIVVPRLPQTMRPVSLLTLLALTPQHLIPPLSMILGLNFDLAPVGARLTAIDFAHMAIIGMRKVGKTAILQSALVSLALLNAPRNLQIQLITPLASCDDLGELPHLMNLPITDFANACDALTGLHSILYTRLSKKVTTPAIVLALDDVDCWLESFPWSTLVEIVQYGAAVNVHVLLSVNKADEVWRQSPALQTAFSAMLIGQCPDAEFAQRMTGYADTHAEQLNGVGHFIVKQSDPAQNEPVMLTGAPLLRDEACQCALALRAGQSASDILMPFKSTLEAG
jgi:hypothetical protein